MAVQDQTHQRATQTLVIIIVLIGVVLRLATLGDKSLWYDEAYTVQRAAMPLDDLWSESLRARTDSHPPLYYAGLHYWMAVTGQSELMLRLPSAVVSIVNLALLYLLARRHFGQTTALFAVSLLALSPLDLWYAQEARMYIFMCSVGLLLALGLWWEHWLALPLLTAVCAIGLYLDYTMLPIWAAISAIWLVDWWQHDGPSRQLLFWATSALLAWLLFRPWHPNFVNMLDRLDGVTFFQRIAAAFGLPDLAGWHFLLALAGLMILFFLLARPLQHGLRHAASQRWFVWLIIPGFALVTLLIPVPRLYSAKRILIQGWPFIVLFVAWLLARQEKHRERLWHLLLTVSLISILITVLLVPKDDWRGAIAHISQHAEADAILLLDPTWLNDVVSLYKPAIQTQRSDPEAFDQLLGRDIWLISERYPNLPIPYTPSEIWLDDNLELVETIPFFRLEVRHYLTR